MDDGLAMGGDARDPIPSESVLVEQSIDRVGRTVRDEAVEADQLAQHVARLEFPRRQAMDLRLERFGVCELAIGEQFEGARARVLRPIDERDVDRVRRGCPTSIPPPTCGGA